MRQAENAGGGGGNLDGLVVAAEDAGKWMTLMLCDDGVDRLLDIAEVDMQAIGNLGDQRVFPLGSDGDLETELDGCLDIGRDAVAVMVRYQ